MHRYAATFFNMMSIENTLSMCFIFFVLSLLFIFLFFHFIHIAKLLIAQGKWNAAVSDMVCYCDKKNNNKFSVFSSKKFCVRKNISFAY